MTAIRTLVALSVCVVILAARPAAAGPSAPYIGEISTSGTAEPQYARVTLEVMGSAIAGVWGEWRISGSLRGDRIELTLHGETAPVGSLTGRVDGTSFAGTGTLAPVRARGGAGGGRGANANANSDEPQPITWKLAPYTPPQAPKTHTFEPTSFYTTYSARWTPVLRLYPGDAVRTRTFDVARDAKATRFGVGGNPSTGPFFVEGALPGDTLVVRLTKVRANRASARQGNRINARAVTAAYLVGAKYDPDFNSEWALDLEKGVATLAHPTERMKGFTVPIKAMLGCVSVAPPGEDQARGTDLGVYGGNLDYNDNVEGTTLHFPVFHAGGLFGIGDAHAAMGDGELTGAALETSADVEFTVDVIKGQASSQVRAETSDYLISFGVSGSVADSIQASTTQLVEWLKKDYGMSDNEVAVFLGAVLKYDIAELVDPHLNIVAKVPKRALASFQKR